MHKEDTAAEIKRLTKHLFLRICISFFLLLLPGGLSYFKKEKAIGCAVVEKQSMMGC